MQNNFYLFYSNCFLLATHLNLKRDSRNATDLVTRRRDSSKNAKEFIVTSPHVMPRPIVSRIANANREREREHVTRTLKRTRQPQDVRNPVQQRKTS